ncbi:MAG: hypothetical protein GF317_04690 [Candidatus Lokiarchaeota archaeon]|nr:hypothetical protein [Candidatus Lokiarchaeota archaeon]
MERKGNHTLRVLNREGYDLVSRKRNVYVCSVCWLSVIMEEVNWGEYDFEPIGKGEV